MYLLKLIKFLVYIFGGLTGLVLLAISYVIQLPIPSSPDIKDLHPQQQESELQRRFFKDFGEGPLILDP